MEFLSGLSIGCMVGFILAGICNAAKYRKKFPTAPPSENAESFKTVA